ncbi:hypothetical protein M409DRAFT_55074 [Zasmidium cellare ATCC 36951]|uniref:Uncharacterized protein n=1 Tax=Zasmidium cellare ATCC 36951 TaxID=1080233 RepID=A0A6A6CJ36_ZASCE|nr:uncharacterized protein M409DRAFT_55074 [Zasmidium cellare ATCC 36951]KAF2166210.1 hypothetical protein M409DRAFT_55074 [Zasmidium cellare ATCC 36951]
MATTADTSATTPPAKMKSPQACLTGLPPELRVRIYGFVFSGLWTKEEEESVEARYPLAKSQELTVPKSKSKDELKEVGEDENQDMDKGQEESNPYRSPDVQSNSEIEVGNDEEAVEAGTELQETPPRQHCCSRHEDSPDIPGADPRPITCTCCFGRLNLSILSTNRLIYSEALPVFYGSVEPRVGLPTVFWSSDPAKDLREVLDRLPQSRLTMVSHVVLFRTTSAIAVGHDCCMLPAYDRLWEALASDLPNLKHVRIHLDLNVVFHVREFPFRYFAGVTRLSKLQTVGIELSCTQFRELSKDINEDGETIADLQVAFAGSIKGKAEGLGKRIEVTVS